MASNWLNTDDAARHLGIGKTKLYALSQSGKIPVSRIGKRWVYDRQLLDEWLRRGNETEAIFTRPAANIEDDTNLREPQRETYARGIEDAGVSTPGVRGDNPIRASYEDTLGRSAIATSFARQVLGLDVSEGVVVGVLGRWGSGKTSFVNLARSEFERAGTPILDFNPWMFSGAQQLVESFFVELSAQLKIRPDLAQFGEDLEEYGEALSGMGWLPLVGPWIERGREATKILAKALQHRKEGVGERRRKLERALRDLAKPIIVVLDDIDRLSTSEIRDMFKLVRLVASFPNIVYVVAFDRARVESALVEEGIPGREYLEKILQVAIDLPIIPNQVLARQVLTSIDSALRDVASPGPFDEQVWPDVFSEIIRPLIRTMRDVRRYAVAIRTTVSELGGHVALADALALEAVRVFLPDVFARLHQAVDGLTATSDLSHGNRQDVPELKVQVNGLIEAAGDNAGVVRSLIKRLFPAGTRYLPGGSQYGPDWKSRWLRQRRVAHEDILRVYLERVAGEGLLAFIEAERAWTLLSERQALDNYLRSLNEERLENVIAALETYEGQFEAKHVVPGTSVLLNLLPDLPERPRGMFGFGKRVIVARVTYRLVRSLKDPVAIEGAVRQVLPELTTLSSKLELITQVGYREGAGHKLVSEDAARDLERSWRDEVRSASMEQLLSEWDLLRVVFLTKRESQPTEGALQIEDSPEMTLAVLRAARGEAQSQAMGSRAVRRFPSLAWDVLVELYGDETTLRQRIDRLKATSLEGNEDLLALADRYLSGRQPSDFGDED